MIGVKPTYFERTCSNSVETYKLLDEPKSKYGPSSNDIAIDFTYNKDAPIDSPVKSLPQKAWIQGNRMDSGKWKVSPMWPIKLDYVILEVDSQDYMYTVIGYPSRDYCWIMYRHPQMPEKTYKMLKERLVEKHQYDLEGYRRVPQVWTKEEREARGLSETEIPDSMLVRLKEETE